MIDWSEKEKEIVMGAPSSGEAVARYFSKYPNSERKKSTIYTYYWWRKQEEKKKDLAHEGFKKVARGAVNILTKIVVEKVKKDIEEEFGKDTDKIVAAPIRDVVHARIVETVFEPGDSVRYTRGSLILSPIGIVVDASKKKGIPEKSQKMKVRFGNYNMRDVYCCDYTIVMKGRKE